MQQEESRYHISSFLTAVVWACRQGGGWTSVSNLKFLAPAVQAGRPGRAFSLYAASGRNFLKFRLSGRLRLFSHTSTLKYECRMYFFILKLFVIHEYLRMLFLMVLSVFPRFEKKCGNSRKKTVATPREFRTRTTEYFYHQTFLTHAPIAIKFGYRTFLAAQSRV